MRWLVDNFDVIYQLQKQIQRTSHGKPIIYQIHELDLYVILISKAAEKYLTRSQLSQLFDELPVKYIDNIIELKH